MYIIACCSTQHVLVTVAVPTMLLQVLTPIGRKFRENTSCENGAVSPCCYHWCFVRRGQRTISWTGNLQVSTVLPYTEAFPSKLGRRSNLTEIQRNTLAIAR